MQNETEALEAARAAEAANHSEGDREEDRDSDGGGNEAEDEHEDDDNSNEGKDHSEKKKAANKTSNHSAVDPFTEIDSFIKSEPTEIDEENFLAYEVTPDIKEEISDSHSGNLLFHRFIYTYTLVIRQLDNLPVQAQL